MQLVFEQIRSGGDRNFGYLLGDREAKVGVLIDPSFSPGTFVTRAREQGLTIPHVLNTHGALRRSHRAVRVLARAAHDGGPTRSCGASRSTSS